MTGAPRGPARTRGPVPRGGSTPETDPPAARRVTSLRPIQGDASTAFRLRMVRLAALAALAITGRLVFLGLPNVALTFFVVFIAGVMEGALFGAAVGLLAMTVTNLMLSGLHPVLLSNGPAMALLGLAGGALRGWLDQIPRDGIDRALRLTTLFAIGFFGTLLFSVCADLVNYGLTYGLTPEGRSIGSKALIPYLLAGLAFNLVPAILNSTPFVFATLPLLHALRRAGLLRAQASAPPSASPATGTVHSEHA